MADHYDVSVTFVFVKFGAAAVGQHRQREFENVVLGIKFGPKGEKATGGRRKLYRVMQ